MHIFKETQRKKTKDNRRKHKTAARDGGSARDTAWEIEYHDEVVMNWIAKMLEYCADHVSDLRSGQCQ